MLKVFYARLSEMFRLMVGIGNYQAYVNHQQKAHPEKAILSYSNYFKYCQEKRYSSRTGKCC